MKDRHVTITVLMLTAIIWIVWDVIAVRSPEEGDTISEVFLWLTDHPIVPFGMGVLCGHWFWPQSKEKTDEEDTP